MGSAWEWSSRSVFGFVRPGARVKGALADPEKCASIDNNHHTVVRMLDSGYRI